MSRKTDQAEARQSLLEALQSCGPEGMGTLCITVLDSMASASGRTEYLEIRVWEPDDHTGGPRPTQWLSRLCCKAFGYRFNEKREALGMGGYGYCRATQIASHLHSLCGHPIRIESLNTFAGPRGWYPKAPQAQPEVRP